MARQPETRLEVGARRFLTRRMMAALVRRDVSMHDDPLRAQSFSLAAGAVVAIVTIAACALLAVVRPRGVPDSAPIVMARDSGALYVRVGDTLHPVLNLASARLIAGTPSNPVPASEEGIARAKKGPLLGTPGAPSAIGAPSAAQPWTVCDGERTVVVLGDPGLDRFDASRAVLVTPRGESAATTYLLYDGRRAEVDLRNGAVVRSLRLDGVAPLAVSRTLLDAVPAVPAIAAPLIAGVGAAGPPALGGVRVGTVVRVLRADTEERYVVLTDGIQPVGEVAADLIRFTYDGYAGQVSTVAPRAVARTPAVARLPVATFPQRAVTPVGAGDGQDVCVTWWPDGSNSTVRSGVPAEIAKSAPLDLAQADGDGPNVDAVVVEGGHSAYVRSAPIAGDDGVTGPRFLVTDAGVVFGIHDDDTAKSLGLGESPEPAPWPVLGRLPRGPELSVEAASVVRDGLAPAS